MSNFSTKEAFLDLLKANCTFPSVIAGMLHNMKEKPDGKLLRVGVLGRGVYPNYQITDKFGEVTIYYGRYHKKNTAMDKYNDKNLSTFNFSFLELEAILKAP